MWSSLGSVFSASVTGTFELFFLCATGAFLSRKHVLTHQVCQALSRGILYAFLPSLLFGSLLRTIYILRKHDNPATLFIPPLLALFTQTVGLLLGLCVVRLFGSDAEPMVKRSCILCVAFGNSNTLPILILRALCESYEPLARFAGGVSLCKARTTGYCSLFLITWSTLFWSVGLRYLLGSNSGTDEVSAELNTIESADDLSATEHSSLIDGSIGEGNDDQVINDVEKHITERTSKTENEEAPQIPGLLTPPTIAIIVAIILGTTPVVSDFLVTAKGPAQSMRLALKLLGNAAIPMSAMIVGAKLIGHFSSSTKPPIPRKLIVAIVSGRLVLMPAIGLFSYLLLRSFLPEDRLLHLLWLTEFNTPTANNNMVIASLAAYFRPGPGSSVEATVATLIFWQYCLLPLILSLNTATTLRVIFPAVAEVAVRE